MRLLLAIQCFFLVLFAGRLPERAQRLLPEPEPPKPPELPPAAPSAEEREAQRRAEAAEAAKETQFRAEAARRGALQLLALLQREGRLIDFLEEEIASFSDAQVGAAARDIHKGCRKVLAEHVHVEPVLPDQDEAAVKVEPGFDPSRIRLVGNVVGQPPFTGTLKHPGWRGAAVTLPDLPASVDPSVIAPAEVELA
jgi:hypothetical protein